MPRPVRGPEQGRRSTPSSRARGQWTDLQLLAAALELCLTSTAADLAVLFGFAGDRAHCLGCRPRHLEHPLAADQSLDWFPWDLRNVRTRRYVFVPEATDLRASPTTRLGDLGVRSAIHLPLKAPDSREGALHLLWKEPKDRWDDTWGAQLRALGSFVLLRT